MIVIYQFTVKKYLAD